MKKKKNINNLQIDNKKLSKAKKNYQKIKRLIEPFIKKRKFKQYSTEGKWSTTTKILKI